MTVLGRAVFGIVALSLTMFAGCQESEDETEPTNVTLPSTEVCGKPSGRFNRIVGGSDAELGMYPWIAAIINYKYYNYQDSKLIAMCTGSLVTEWHLVTSARCVVRVHEYCEEQTDNNVTPCNMLARLGVLDLNHVEPTGTEADYELDTLTAHPGHPTNWGQYDIGVVKLKKRVTFSRFIQPICLPVQLEFRTKSFTGSIAYIAGWEWIKYRGKIATRLQEAQVREWSRGECSGAIEDDVLHDQVCVAGDDIDEMCHTRFYGPLMLPYGPDCNYYLYGVDNVGYSCGFAGTPAVYSRVPNYIDWVLAYLI